MASEDVGTSGLSVAVRMGSEEGKRLGRQLALQDTAACLPCQVALGHHIDHLLDRLQEHSQGAGVDEHLDHRHRMKHCAAAEPRLRMWCAGRLDVEVAAAAQPVVVDVRLRPYARSLPPSCGLSIPCEFL